MVHVQHAVNSTSPVIARSHSGDTDIFVMVVRFFYSTSLILDTGSDARRKIVQEKRLCVNNDQVDRNALIGFHAFTGCGYISSFFRKATQTW